MDCLTIVLSVSRRGTCEEDTQNMGHSRCKSSVTGLPVGRVVFDSGNQSINVFTESIEKIPCFVNRWKLHGAKKHIKNKTRK